MILILISRPLRPWKVGLAAAMAACYGAAMAVPFLREFFELDVPSLGGWLCVLAAVVVGGVGCVGRGRTARAHRRRTRGAGMSRDDPARTHRSDAPA